jgi:hypothetical protein
LVLIGEEDALGCSSIGFFHGGASYELLFLRPDGQQLKGLDGVPSLGDDGGSEPDVGCHSGQVGGMVRL